MQNPANNLPKPKRKHRGRPRKKPPAPRKNARPKAVEKEYAITAVKVDPYVIDKARRKGRHMLLTQPEYIRVAIKAFFRYVANTPGYGPVLPPTHCAGCGRSLHGMVALIPSYKPIKLNIALDDESANALIALADLYFGGSWSLTVEAALSWYTEPKGTRKKGKEVTAPEPESLVTSADSAYTLPTTDPVVPESTRRTTYGTLATPR